MHQHTLRRSYLVATLVTLLMCLAGMTARAAPAVEPDLPAENRLPATPEEADLFSLALQGYIYGYPIVALLAQQHNETHRVSENQPIAAPVNTMAVYPHLLTPATQGRLRAPNADTIYLNAWLDLSRGPVMLDVPAMADRYYTLAFMDLYGKPHHLGTRTNGGRKMRYALIGPGEDRLPENAEAIRLPTDTVWLLGRVLVEGPDDEASAIALAREFRLRGHGSGGPVERAAPLDPMADLRYFSLLNNALKSLPAVPGEAALMALFDRAGFGPSVTFEPERLSASRQQTLLSAIDAAQRLIKQSGFKPTSVVNGWMVSSAVGDPGFDYLLRAELARGGYVNAPEESIYPAAVTDERGDFLSGGHRYRIRFAPGGLPPVNAFWSITAYDSNSQLTANPINRYTIGDRTPGLVYDPDGGLTLLLSSREPDAGASNWLPVPSGPFHLVTRLYLPKEEALSGEYALPPVKRVDE
jgi:hypothetical protein